MSMPLAACANADQTIPVLLSNGANPELKDNKDRTALD
jgi:hypothetical protein